MRAILRKLFTGPNFSIMLIAHAIFFLIAGFAIFTNMLQTTWGSILFATVALPAVALGSWQGGLFMFPQRY